MNNKIYNEHFIVAGRIILKALFQQLILGLLLFIIWWAIYFFNLIPKILLASPIEVIVNLFNNIRNYLPYVWHTVMAGAIGLLAAVILVLLTAILGVKFRFILRIMSAFSVLSQTTPVIAIAPLLIYMSGFSIKTQAFVAFLIAFFPLGDSCIRTISFCPREFQNFAYALELGTIDKIRWIDGPRILEAIITSLPLSAVLALIGSIVYEFVSPDKGIGKLIVMSQRTFNIIPMFSGVILAVISGFLVFGSFQMVNIGYRIMRRDLAVVATNKKH